MSHVTVRSDQTLITNINFSPQPMNPHNSESKSLRRATFDQAINFWFIS